MSEAETTAQGRRGWQRAAGRLGVHVLRASLIVSPRPITLLLRREFAKSGASRAERLRPLAPEPIQVTCDQTYGPDPDCRFDVYTPHEGAVEGNRLPVLMWVHGGAFVGGSKDEIDYYFRAVAASGFCVVAIGYSLAPESTYPTPVRQALAALHHIQSQAERLHADPKRIMLAGDSAGSHISAQLAAAITNPPYARQIGLDVRISPDQLRAVVLCCGIYDFVAAATNPTMKTFMLACGWAYSGVKDFLDDPYFVATTAVGNNITPAFPPAFLTVGNVDPLRTQTEGLLTALQRAGVPTESLTYPAEHQPPLSHEYQFDLELADARVALERLTDFLHRNAD
ncbi:MAG TPA: alpha/beta hydrolase [Microlunatus sp.]|nr:alpha/beta hydrolase [Microlunatus sp.]